MKIACINYQPVTLYLRKGSSLNRLSQYYNPNNVADTVWIFAYNDCDWQISENVHVVGWKSFQELKKKCLKFKPDIIRCYEAFQPFCDYALYISLLLQIPSYLSLHDQRVKYSNRIKYFSIITGYTGKLSEKVAKGLKRKVETQLNGVDSYTFKPLTPTLIDKRVANAKYKIFSIGREDPVKNITPVLKATSILSQRFGSIAHVIAGSGTEMISYDGIHLGLGSVPHKMINEYLNWCDCYVQLQLVSDVGMATTEALMVGKPVIITSSESGNSIDFIDDSMGYLIPIEKAQDENYISLIILKCLEHKYNSELIRKKTVAVFDVNKLRKQEAIRYLQLYSKHKGRGAKHTLSKHQRKQIMASILRRYYLLNFLINPVTQNLVKFIKPLTPKRVRLELRKFFQGDT